MVDDHKVEVVLDHIGSEITIDATVETETDSCTVHIRHSHTNIDSIERITRLYIRQMRIMHRKPRRKMRCPRSTAIP